MTYRKITVWVLEAKELKGVGSDHSSNPYVSVSIGDQRKLRAETFALKHTLNPVWNCKMVLSPVYLWEKSSNDRHPFDELRFAVWADRLLSDKHLGIAYQKIDPNWRDNEVHEMWLELREGQGMLKVRVSTERLYSKKLAKRLGRMIEKGGVPWEDPDFRHNALSVSPDGHDTKGVTGWKRLRDLSKTPQLFHDKARSGDVLQGALGDCWLLGAMAIVATRPDLVRPLFVTSNFEAGYFIVRFFILGEWRWVVVDDALPVGAAGELRFGRCRDADEFWVAILEKAYAKIFRSYGALEAGNTAEGLVDLTGEGAETYSTDDPRFLKLKASGQIEHFMKHWKKSRFLMGCSRVQEGAESESDTGMGILAGHAYSVLDIKNPTTEKGFLGLIGNKHTVLIKVRNPWGDTEWKGAWSDGSKEMTPAMQKLLKHEVANDGIFFMDVEDFFQQFNRLSVVRMFSHKFSIFDRKWHQWHFNGEFDAFSDGGCMNHETWVKNSQYGLEVMDDKHPTTVFVYVSQPDRRFQNRQDYDASIGCYILQVENAHEKVTDRGKIKRNTFPPWDEAPTFINKRDNGVRVDLPAGQYVIIPCTFVPGQRFPFTLGVFAERRAKCWEILTEQETGITVDFSDQTAGGPPDIGELARSDKHGYEASFYNNPKAVLHFKSARRVQDEIRVTVRVEAKTEIASTIGLRVYRKCKAHRRDPLKEKFVIDTVAPSTNKGLVKEYVLQKKQAPFCFVPFTQEKGVTGSVAVSVNSKEPGLFLEPYY